MKKHYPASASGAWPVVVRRYLLGGAVLLVLTALAGLLAFHTRDEAPASGEVEPEVSGRPTRSAPSVSEPSPEDPAPDADGPGSGGRSRSGDPVVFAKAAAVVLWSYDTRSASHKEHLAGLKEWMTGEGRYADWASVKKQLPDEALWERMAENKQRASVEAAQGRFPQAFLDAMADEPGAITEAYVYVVTVHGKQTLAWTGSGAGAEARSVTLAVQCRPDTWCGLAGVLPQVLP
jgi:hypothetical protein